MFSFFSFSDVSNNVGDIKKQELTSKLLVFTEEQNTIELRGKISTLFSGFHWNENEITAFMLEDQKHLPLLTFGFRFLFCFLLFKNPRLPEIST